MSIAPLYVPPGPYFKIEDVPAPLASPGAFYPLLIGLGRKELDVLKTLTRGATPEDKDLLSDSEIVISLLSVVDSTGIVYTKDVDFKLTESTGDYYVDWEMPVSVTGTEDLTDPVVTTGLTLKLNIDGVQSTISFTITEVDIASIISKINATYAAAASDDGSGHLKITGDALVMVEGGSALSVLGFVNGVKSQAKEPSAGVTYTVGYKRHKLATEYKQNFFTRLEDVYAEYGAVVTPTEIVSGTLTTTSTGANLVDTAADFVTLGVVPGNYIKITAGTGEGQIRVIQTVVSATEVTVYPDWDENPDTSSDYSLTDVGYNDLSRAAFYANEGGAQAFVMSQTIDDIVDDNNWRKAYVNTETLVSGQQGYCVVPVKGFNFGDSLIGYTKNYVNTMNSTVVNQERTALLSVASNITFNDMIQLCSGIADEDIGVIVNKYVRSGSDVLGSQYLAAYIAGIFCNPDYDAGEPISGKIISGFDYIDDQYLMNEKRLIGQNGGILVQQEGAVQKIVHFLSTNQTDTIKSELKVAKQKHSIKKSLRKNLQASIVNTRSQDITLPRAESIVRMILEDKVRTGEINAFRNLSIAFEVNNPRQLNISFVFKPTFDVNWILTTFGATIS